MNVSTDLRFAALTDVGRKREHNEDQFLVDRDLGLFVVADGMGGHAAGEVASAIAVRTVHEVIAAQREQLAARAATAASGGEHGLQEVLGLVEYAVTTASARIHAEAARDPDKRGMGTTLSMLLLLGGHAFVAHVGDSRIYMLRQGDVRQVTDDHTVARELLRLGMVTPDQLHNVPKKHAITRAVGVYPHVQVDTMSFEVLPDDRFLLCSDGLAGYFDDTTDPIVPYLDNDDGDASVKELIDFANGCGGKDNITAVVVHVAGGDAADGLRARRVALKREVLASMPLFARLDDRQLMSVMAVADLEAFEAGACVMREGDQGDAMYVIVSGRLRVEKGGATIGELSIGDQLGEMALIRANPRSATVTAIESSHLIRIRRGDFFDILRNDAVGAVQLLWQFINVLADRLDRTSQDLSMARLELGVEAKTPEAPPTDARVENPFALPGRRTLALGSFRIQPDAAASAVDEDASEGTDGPERSSGASAPTVLPLHLRETRPGLRAPRGHSAKDLPENLRTTRRTTELADTDDPDGRLEAMRREFREKLAAERDKDKPKKGS